MNNYSQHRLIAGSMRNISELIQNSSNSSSPKAVINEDQNYSNLQQALRAATAALQKSKMMPTNQPMSKSNVNLASQEPGLLSFQPYTKQQHERPNSIHRRVYKNTVNLKIENKSVNCSDYDNIEDNIDISVNLTNCARHGDEISLLDETMGRRQVVMETAVNETVSSSFSSPSSVSSSTKSSESR